MTNELLEKIYYNHGHPASFSTAIKLYKNARLNDPSLTLGRLQYWLKGELTYTLHKFHRNKIIVSAIDEQWQTDLVDMQEFANSNNGYKYILTVIDIFSEYAFAILIRNKKADSVLAAFQSKLKNRIPTKLQTDQGKEFVNTQLQKYLKQMNIKFFTSYNDVIKCAVIERFNRTLKSKMFKYFTSKGTRRYIDVLSKLVESYNNTYHRTIKMKASQVTRDNETEVFYNTYKMSHRIMNLSKGTHRLAIDEKVRRRYKRNPFDKGFYTNWSDKVYTIKYASHNKKPMYTITDEQGNLIKGRYYNYDLQNINRNVFRVEKILNRRTRNGKT